MRRASDTEAYSFLRRPIAVSFLSRRGRKTVGTACDRGRQTAPRVLAACLLLGGRCGLLHKWNGWMNILNITQTSDGTFYMQAVWALFTISASNHITVVHEIDMFLVPPWCPCVCIAVVYRRDSSNFGNVYGRTMTLCPYLSGMHSGSLARRL